MSIRLSSRVLAAALIASSRLQAQAATGSLDVTVQTDNGKPVQAMHFSLGASPLTMIPPASPIVRESLPPGPIRVRLRSLGYLTADTTVVIAAGQTTTVTLTLRDSWREEMRQWAAADATAGAAGRVDSIAAQRVRRDSSGWATWAPFSARLLQQLVTERTPNETTMLSAFSAGQALSIAMLGAGDSTMRAMQAALGVAGLPIDSLARMSARFNASLDTRSDVQLLAANALWLDPSRKLKLGFAQRARNLAPNAVRSAYLTRTSGIEAINAWADSMTSGKIRTLFAKPFEDSTKLVITNAVYLKATWLIPFEKALTVPRPFMTAGGRRVVVPTMEATRGFSYVRDSGVQVLRLPFKSGLVAMYFLLPDRGTTIAPLLARISARGWPLPDGASPARDVHLRLPRVHIEQSLDLKTALSRLGMGIVFDPLRADFRELLELQPGEHTFITTVQQKLYLDLDETGAVAAAVTAVGGGVIVDSVPPPPIEFFIDRPFIFVIQDERTGTMLFVGYVAAP